MPEEFFVRSYFFGMFMAALAVIMSMHIVESNCQHLNEVADCEWVVVPVETEYDFIVVPNP